MIAALLFFLYFPGISLYFSTPFPYPLTSANSVFFSCLLQHSYSTFLSLASADDLISYFLEKTGITRKGLLKAPTPLQPTCKLSLFSFILDKLSVLLRMVTPFSCKVEPTCVPAQHCCSDFPLYHVFAISIKTCFYFSHLKVFFSLDPTSSSMITFFLFPSECIYTPQKN